MATVVRSAVSADSWVQSAAQRGCWGSSWGVGSSGGSGFQARYSRAFAADLFRSRDFQVGRFHVMTDSSLLFLSGHYPDFTHNYSGDDKLTSRVRA